MKATVLVRKFFLDMHLCSQIIFFNENIFRFHLIATLL